MLPIDKSNHLIYGVVIFIIAYFLLKRLVKKNSGIISFLFVIIIAIVKEVYDLQNLNTNTPEIYDIIFTIFGGLIGLLITFI